MENKKIKKIHDKMEVDEAINLAKLENAKFNLKEKEIFKQIDELNRETKKDKKVKFSGTILYLLSILGLIASTSLSICSGLKLYPEHKIAFIITIIFVQLVIFKVSTNTTIIKQSFKSHYTKVKLMQYGLLAVIIFYNYNFFYSYIADKGILLKLITFILCFLMDYSTMQFVSLAFDQKHLNYSKNNFEHDTSLLGMIFFNLTCKARFNALKQYKKNIKQFELLNAENLNQESSEEREKVYIKVFEENADRLEESETKLIEQPKEDPEENLFEKKILNLDNIQKVFDYIQENRIENISPGMGKISKNTGVNSGEVDRIRKELIKHGYLQPDKEKMQTLVIRDELNILDFEGEDD